MSKNIGLDVGTNLLVSAKIGPEGSPVFKAQRDAFYKITPKSDVNRNAVMASLEKRVWRFSAPFPLIPARCIRWRR